MGYRFQHIEKGIVHIRWIETVTIDELDVGVKQVSQQINEEGCHVYVEIIDLLDCKAIPFDLRGLRRISTYDSRIIGYIIVKPNALAKSMANMLIQVTSLPFRVASSLDEALISARLMLSEHLPTKI